MADWLATKKKTYGYRQGDETKRSAFVAQTSDPQALYWVYVDESGMDERDNYGFGYSPAGGGAMTSSRDGGKDG